MKTPLHSNDSDALEALLKSQRESIPDNGFSSRVLAALPEKHPSQTNAIWRQRVLVSFATLAGLTTAYLHCGIPTTGEFQKFNDSFTHSFSTLVSSNPPMLWTSVIVIGVSLVFAFQREIVRILGKI